MDWLPGVLLGAVACCVALSVRWLVLRLLTRRAGAVTSERATWLALRLLTLLWGLFAVLGVSAVLISADLDWTHWLRLVARGVLIALSVFSVVWLARAAGLAFSSARLREVRPLDYALGRLLIWLSPPVGVFVAVVAFAEMAGADLAFIREWLLSTGVRLVVIVVVLLALIRLAGWLGPRLVRDLVTRPTTAGDGLQVAETEKRVETVSSVVGTSVEIILLTILVFMLLAELGLNIVPALAGFGIAGVAIGLGAQSLVKDLIGGLFVVMENQYRKGDVVNIAGVSGTVEEINLRRTMLRDVEGVVHVVPNGQIGVASNFTKDYSRACVTLSVSYATSLARAIEIANRVGQEMYEDEALKASLLSQPKVLRVDDLGLTGISIKMMADTKPMARWDVMGELRLRLKKAFDLEGIEFAQAGQIQRGDFATQDRPRVV